MIAALWKKFNELIWGTGLYRHGIAGRLLVGVLRNAYAVTRDIFSGQLTLRSMSLVYTTLLSVVPLIAFSFSVLKGLGVAEELETRLPTILEPLGAQAAEMITGHIIQIVHRVNGSVLGGIGLAFFVYTAIAMVQKIEEAFNYVWYVSKPRSFARRFAEYMLVLLVGPVLMVTAFGAIASLQSEAIIQWMANSALFGPVITATSKLTPFLLVTAVFAFLYFYMPNTQVNVSSAIVGGIAGGFMWAATGLIFAAFVANSVAKQAVYASFAIAITTLIWLYLNWLILLIGAQIAFYFQNPAYLRIGRREPRLSNEMRERLALNIMLLIGRAFRDTDKSIDLHALSDKLQIPSITIAPVLLGLESNGLLTATENESLVPACDMSRIKLSDILDVVRVEGETGSYRDPQWEDAIDTLCNNIDTAVDGALGDRTLSQLLDETDGDDN